MDTAAWLDQHDAWLTDTIRRHGWAIQYVGGGTCCEPDCDGSASDEAPYAYTTGLFGLGHPELLILGVDPPTAAGVLNQLAVRVRNGEHLVPGVPVGLDCWPHHIVPDPVPEPGDIVLQANRFYRRPADHSVPALHLTFDDDRCD